MDSRQGESVSAAARAMLVRDYLRHGHEAMVKVLEVRPGDLLLQTLLADLVEANKRLFPDDCK